MCAFYVAFFSGACGTTHAIFLESFIPSTHWVGQRGLKQHVRQTCMYFVLPYSGQKNCRVRVVNWFGQKKKSSKTYVFHTSPQPSHRCMCTLRSDGRRLHCWHTCTSVCSPCRTCPLNKLENKNMFMLVHSQFKYIISHQMHSDVHILPPCLMCKHRNVEHIYYVHTTLVPALQTHMFVAGLAGGINLVI